MLALSRAYVTGPKMVLVDEPSLGLAPLSSARLLMPYSYSFDKESQSSLSISTCNLAETVYILSRGRIAHTGPAKDLATSEIYEMYLGIEA